MFTSTRPTWAVASCISTHSALLCDQMPTRSPLYSPRPDRKSTRLNSSHLVISYAVFCLKKKTEFTATLPASHESAAAGDDDEHAALASQARVVGSGRAHVAAVPTWAPSVFISRRVLAFA